MGRKRTSGLIKRQGIWHIDKQVRGQRICQSCDTDKLEEAEKRIEMLQKDEQGEPRRDANGKVLQTPLDFEKGK